MHSERVDKTWQNKGIDTYSLDAIFGTLAHYGVVVDEHAYRKLASESFPLSIAMRWHDDWRGTGQFARFPASASEELWRRFLPEALAPSDLALALIKLLIELADVLEQNVRSDTLETRFKVVEAFLPKLPQVGDRRERFLAELTRALGDELEDFDEMAFALAESKHHGLADRFVAIEESVFEVRQGIVSAEVLWAKGEKTTAVAQLTAIANDAGRDDFARLGACDALMDMNEFVAAGPVLSALLDKATDARDLALAVEVTPRLEHFVKKDRALALKLDIRARVERLFATLKA